MSNLLAAPETITTAAADLASIGSALDAAHAAAAHQTLAVAPAAADEVSVGIAQGFAQHAEDFFARAAQAAAYHGQFAQNLRVSAASYSSVEELIASVMQGFNAQVRSLFTYTEQLLVDDATKAFLGWAQVVSQVLPMPQAGQAILITGFFSLVGVTFAVVVLDSIAQAITGQFVP